MENPATWNDTQKAIAAILYEDATLKSDAERAQQIVVLLGETSLTTENISELMIEHGKSLRDRRCGLSLVAKIWGAHSG